ncbi:MAG: hypothetical protein AAF645_18950 [Myxococcota bacterium]
MFSFRAALPILVALPFMHGCGASVDSTDAAVAADLAVDPARDADAAPRDAAPNDGAPTDAAPDQATVNRCNRPVSSVPSELGADAFYAKYLDADGIPVLASAQVRDAALQRACAVVLRMLSARRDVRDELLVWGIHVAIIGVDELTTDIPEYATLYEDFPGVDWNARARGLGATATLRLSSVGEENLLGLPGDVHEGEDIMVHEFAHTFFDLGVRSTAEGTVYRDRLQSAYNASLREGRYADTYALSETREYFAESVQSWFDVNLEAEPADGVHNFVNTQEELRLYDPAMAEILEELFPASLDLPAG